MTDIDDRLRVHYRGLRLADSKVRQISEVNTGNAVSLIPASVNDWRIVSRAFSVLMVVALIIGIHQYGTHAERATRTFNEAAMNHSTRLQLEFETQSISEIDSSMTQLPFEVALPAEFGEQLVLLGARYCTINGELAAHVKFLDKSTDKQVSLFMTRGVDGLHKKGEARERIDGVNVKLWNESGLYYVMASRSPII